jgi:hypothetical protein
MDQACWQLNCWETQEQINACRAANGVSPRQHERWAGLGHVPHAEQRPMPGGGSFVVYPPGTCAQLAAAARLFREKSLAEHVGKMLWWEGYPVDEKCWLPKLTRLANSLDRILKLLGQFIRHHDRNENSETLGDRLARSNKSNIVLSRIKRRLSVDERALLFGTTIELALGEGIGIEILRAAPPARATDDKSRVERGSDWLIRALDMSAADRDTVLGYKFTFRKALPGVLETISTAFATGSFSECVADRKALFAARDDVRNGLSIGADMYEAWKDIYGSGAFGLRLISWISNKKPELLIAAVILGIMRLRQIPNDLHLSPEIAKMAHAAKRCRNDAETMRRFRSSHPHFKEVLSPRRLRLGFRDESSYGQLLKEIEAARLQS